MTQPFEPIAVEALYPPPRAAADPDPEKGWIRRLMPLLLAYRGPIAVFLAASVGTVGVSLAIPVAVGYAVDALEDDQPVLRLAALIAGLAALAGVLSFVHTYWMRKTVQSLEYDLRALVYRHLTRLSFSFYDRVQTGQLISRANSDLRAVIQFLGFTPNLTTMALRFVLAVGIMAAHHVGLAVVAIVTLPGVYLVGIALRSRLFPISWLIQARQADVATIVEENVTGVRIVKSFAAEARQIGLLARAAKRLRWTELRRIGIRARFSPPMENFPGLARGLVLLYGVTLLYEGQISPGTLAMFGLFIIQVQAPFRMLGFFMTMSQRAAASARRLFDIFDQEPEIQDRPGAIDLVDPRGEVEFRNVTFGYGSGPPLLRGLSLQLKPGETVAVVGRTGCGKSTLARLLPRFYDVQEGAVLVDGVDVRDYTVKSLRAHIGLVLDEPFLFSETIQANASYGRPDAELDEIIDVARAAGAHDFIEELPLGYATVVGERGYTLSGGQRQRVAIARTLLDNPKILILDDATSAIDVRLEQQIHSALRGLMRGRTTLIIAHRLSTIRLADRVLLLDGGRIVADGTHDELMREVKEYAEILIRAEEEWKAAHPPRPASDDDGRPRRPLDADAERPVPFASEFEVPEPT